MKQRRMYCLLAIRIFGVRREKTGDYDSGRIFGYDELRQKPSVQNHRMWYTMSIVAVLNGYESLKVPGVRKLAAGSLFGRDNHMSEKRTDYITWDGIF